MKLSATILSLLFLLPSVSMSQVLVGYWHNWNATVAPYINIDQIDSRYDIIEVAFAIPRDADDNMVFTPDAGGPSQATLIGQIQTLQGLGKKVLISIGGANNPVSLDSLAERDNFIATMGDIIDTYGFDGFDIDLEGGSVSTSGGTTIMNPTDDKILNLIYAIKQIISNHATNNGGEKLMLTMAPETAFVQGALSNFGGIWGAYLPVIHGVRDELDLLQVQLYNTGTMFGIDRRVYSSSTADFIVAMSEAVIQGFTAVAGGGPFPGLPASKVAVALPACPSAAGSGFTDPAEVARGMNYLLGRGPKPGSYTLVQSGGYPDFGGMMTWSINWDAVDSCNASSYEFAQNFENIFSTTSSISETENPKTKGISLYPNPAKSVINVSSSPLNFEYTITSVSGQEVGSGFLRAGETRINLENLTPGVYLIQANGATEMFIKMK